MIRYVKNETIDRGKYDRCIGMDPLGLVYAYSWYLNTVCEDWDALVLDDYAAVWPLPSRRKFGLKYFYRPFAVQQLGIFSGEPLDEKVILAFVTEMQKHCIYADVYLNEDQVVGLDPLKKVSDTLNTNLILDLNVSYREIYHGYNQSTRRNIKKASKSNLQLFEHDDPNALIEIFKQNRGASLNLKEEFFRNIEKTMYRCLHNNTGKVWTVYGSHNSICAGAFIVETERRHTLLFTALTEQGKELSAMHYLLNEYIIYHSATPKLFDFEGSNLKSLARFYGGFGAVKKHYQGLQYNNLPLPLRWIQRK